MSMSEAVYLNGKYIPKKDASLSILDRGFLFGDGVYELIPIYNKKIFYVHDHLDRLKSSLEQINVSPQLVEHNEFQEIINSLIKKNDYTNHYNSTAISLNINVPIFSGGLISHQVKQAAYNYADDQQQLYIDQQSVRDGLKSSLEQLKIGNELRGLDTDTVQAQKQAYDDTFTAYQAGKRDVQIFQVIQAQSYVLSASQSKINNLYNYVLSQIQLKYSLGDLSEKDVISLNSYLV